MTTPDFSDLRPYVEAWGLATSAERLNKRCNSSQGELKAFYDAVAPRLQNIIDFLNQFPLRDIPQEHQGLARTALAALEVSGPVNSWGAPLLELAHDPREWRTKTHYSDYR